MPADSKPLSTTSRLNTLMAAQRKAIDELTQINQLRQTLKNSVIGQVKINLEKTLAGTQLRDLINNRGTQAELDHIVGRLTLRPHQDIAHLTDAVAKELVAASDHRLQLLVRLASKNPRDDFQKQLNESIEKDAQAKLSLKLIESKQVDGKDSNQILESLKAASMSDSSGRTRLGAKLESFLPDDYKHKINDLEETLEAQALTTHIDDDNVAKIVDKALKHHSITLDPSTQTEIAREIGAALKLESATIDSSDYLSEFRTQMIADGTNADAMSAKLSDGGYSVDDVYYADDNKKSLPQITPDSIRLVERIIKNPELLNDSAIYKEFLSGSRFSPSELVRQWRTFFNPSSSSSPSLSSGFAPTIRSWGSGLLSKFQVSTKGFFEGARTLLQPLGKIAGKLGSSLGTTLKSFGTTIGSTLKTVLPAIGRGLLAFGKIAVGVLSKAAVAVIASAEVWLPIVLIGLVVVILFLTIFSPSPFTVARTNLAPVAAGGGDGGSDPYDGPLIVIDINGKICWPVTGSFFGYMPENHPSVSSNQSAIDIDNVVGTPIIAPVGGTVSFSGWNSYGYGNLVLLSVQLPGSGGSTQSCTMYFGHMSQITIPKGTSTITAGTQLGLMGNTGNSTGPHLHWGLTCSGGKPNIRDLFPPPDRNVKFGDSTSTQCAQK